MPRLLNPPTSPEIIREIIVATWQAFPTTELFCSLKRFNTNNITQTLDRYASFVLQLQAQDVPFDHVGLQLYFGQDDVEALGGVNTLVSQMSAAISSFA